MVQQQNRKSLMRCEEGGKKEILLSTPQFEKTSPCSTQPQVRSSSKGVAFDKKGMITDFLATMRSENSPESKSSFVKR